jgi:hypothetical protein
VAELSWFNRNCRYVCTYMYVPLDSFNIIDDCWPLALLVGLHIAVFMCYVGFL